MRKIDVEGVTINAPEELVKGLKAKRKRFEALYKEYGKIEGTEVDYRPDRIHNEVAIRMMDLQGLSEGLMQLANDLHMYASKVYGQAGYHEDISLHKGNKARHSYGFDRQELIMCAGRFTSRLNIMIKEAAYWRVLAEATYLGLYNLEKKHEKDTRRRRKQAKEKRHRGSGDSKSKSSRTRNTPAKRNKRSRR